DALCARPAAGPANASPAAPSASTPTLLACPSQLLSIERCDDRLNPPCLPEALIVEVLDDLVRTGPLLRRDDEVDVTTSEPIQRMIGDATGINIHLPEPVAPCHGRCLLLERADCLPALNARIAD
ncbi:MAG: hypothetical protein ACXVGO_13020, partial [Mycobacterium sp.]